MTMQYGLIVPQGWRMDLVGIADPVEAYETMTRVAQEAEALDYSSIWLFDHFHTVPVPTQEVTHITPQFQNAPTSKLCHLTGGFVIFYHTCNEKYPYC